MNSDDDDEWRTLLTWVMRIVGIVGIVAAFMAVGYFIRKRDGFSAVGILFTIPVLALILSRYWTGSLFGGVEAANRYVDGVDGKHRHEWYAFKGQRIRVLLDSKQQPWFAVMDIAGTLDITVDGATFRGYGRLEHGIPKSASEKYLSERGLRRLIKSSTHNEAGALSLWLERDVLRVLRIKNEGRETSEPIPGDQVK